jgi:hypothetical protein
MIGCGFQQQQQQQQQQLSYWTYHVAYASTTRGRSHSVNIISNSSPDTIGAAFTSSAINNAVEVQCVFIVETFLAPNGDVVNACVDDTTDNAVTATRAIDFMVLSVILSKHGQILNKLYRRVAI